MTAGSLYETLIAALALSLLISFSYMIQKRGLISALFWTFIPMRWLLSWGSDTPYDDNPDWLDRVQVGLIAALMLLWLATKAKLIA